MTDDNLYPLSEDIRKQESEWRWWIVREINRHDKEIGLLRDEFKEQYREIKDTLSDLANKSEKMKDSFVILSASIEKASIKTDNDLQLQIQNLSLKLEQQIKDITEATARVIGDEAGKTAGKVAGKEASKQDRIYWGIGVGLVAIAEAYTQIKMVFK